MKVFSLLAAVSDTGNHQPPVLTEIPGVRLVDQQGSIFPFEFDPTQIHLPELRRLLKEQGFTLEIPKLPRLVIQDESLGFEDDMKAMPLRQD